MYPSVPSNLVQILPFFGGWSEISRTAYLVKKWRRTYVTFRVIIATARGWDHYCADDAMVDAVEAAVGGITFDGATPARGTDPVFEYKRVAIAWHESDQASSTDTNSSSTSGANSPRSPRNHSDLKPLGLFYIDHTSTVAISELKVCRGQLMKLYQCFHLHTIFPSFLTYVSQIHGENVPVITVTSRAGAGNGGYRRADPHPARQSAR